MIVFPNAKINLGLNIVARRSDGYHDLDMVMFPIGWCDILEIVPSSGDKTKLTTTGRPVNCLPEKNLVFKAWSLLNEYVDGNLPPVDIFLHKIIPDGAGLGGGSSDAAFTLVTLNRLFALDLSDSQLCEVAACLGADCPFFIYNRPMLCRGTGTLMTPIDVNMEGIKAILIAKPEATSVSTAEAYSGVIPAVPNITTDMVVSQFMPEEWTDRLINGFEKHIFELKPEIAQIKRYILDSGAVYASMSGSGSAVYGLFSDVSLAESAARCLSHCACFIDKLG
ncbi:MAG: 4-(cytidine 5'-diphospho)-2-C-methyl-D-erythritol kinase [Muribaculaceae bacterium]|nr:4-(cytidine 5'-diphospho)-2-C-methyl-D-erythritol kinase [Muribaculaceae bacterium]